MESIRVDQWLWAVRLFKTRSESTEACRAGHVRVNGAPVKPAAKVHVGDRVTARAHQRERIFEVVALINKRVSAPLAAECLVLKSPPRLLIAVRHVSALLARAGSLAAPYQP